MMQGVVLEEWAGGLNVGWQVADKIRANQCEGVAFCKIEKGTKLKAEKGTLHWLQTTDVEFDPCKTTFVGMECGEGIG